MGLLAAARGLTAQYALHVLAGPARPEAGVWAVWYVDWALSLLFPDGLLMFLVLLFPDGRPVTARWRSVGWLGVGLTAVYLLVTWLGPGPIALGSGLPSVPNPTAVPSLIHAARDSSVTNGIWVLGWIPLLLAAASLVVRYRRSVGEERLQLKWSAYAAVSSLGLLAALTPVSAANRNGDVAFDGAVVAGIGLALPLAIGVAILKYRLYAIDRIVSRTVSYALVTGLVVGVYLGCVALLTKVLPYHGNVGIAIAVLAAAALFNPLRRRVQAVVDRRFDRARYDAERVVAQFSGQLRQQVDLEVLGADLLGVVNQVLTPEHVALWLNDTVSGSPAAGAKPPDP